MNVLIMAENGRIARIVEHRILTENQFSDINLTLFLRNSSRVTGLPNSMRVTVVEGDIDNAGDVDKAMENQDLVFVAVVDHDKDNAMTNNVIQAMKNHGVSRVLFTNILGIYNEVPGEFGRWNHEFVKDGLPAAINSDKLLSDSGLDYTTLRLPWLNDRDEVKYEITHRHDQYNGVSGSRQSVADLILSIIKDNKLGSRYSLGLADPATQGQDRPVY